MGLLILPYQLVCLPAPADRITTLRIPARNCRHRRRAVRRSGSVLPDAPSSTRTPLTTAALCVAVALFFAWLLTPPP